MPVTVTPEGAHAAAPRDWTRRWWFRVALLVVAFAVPPVVGSPVDPRDIPSLTAEVLQNPLIVQVPMLLPLAKLVAIGVVLAAWCSATASARTVLVGYSVALLLVGILQNVAFTPTYGWAWLAGNTVLMFVVAARCIWDLGTRATPSGPRRLVRHRLWVLVPMLLAFLMPYAVDASGSVRASLGWQVLTNEAAVTYCMITPVVIGALLLYARPVSPATLSLISFVGLYFGVLNVVIWWGLQPRNWWMGVLHLPLVVLAIAGLLESRPPRIERSRDAVKRAG